MAAKQQNAKVGNQRRIYADLVEKSISLVRQDIMKWKAAWRAALNADYPSRYQLYNLYDTDILQDALITSQIENRIQATLGANFNLYNSGGDIDKELTAAHQNTELFNELIKQILNTRFFGHSLIEFDWDDSHEKLSVNLIPRQNVLPKQGTVLKDYSEQNGIQYRDESGYGVWILEFGSNIDLGLLNKAVPHVLFKKFAQSCWSELAEIYGIPPRVYKTDTQDPQALARGKRMMKDMGAAAWFIIDTTEEFEWAKGVSTNGDVYNNLIRLSDNQNSLLIQGAIIGQDTEHGSYGKDAAGQNLLNSLVLADMALVEMYMNSKVMPALAAIGIVPADTKFKFEMAEDLAELWKMTTEALPYYEIDPEWIKDKFGLEVTGKREQSNPFGSLNAAESFFV